MRSLYYNLESFREFFEVHFVLVKSGEIEKRVLFSLPEGIKFSEVECTGPSPSLSSFLFPLHWKAMARIQSAQKAVQKYIDENQIDVVIFHSMDVTFALRSLRAKAKVGFQIDSFSNYYLSKWKFTRSPLALLLAAVQTPLYWLIERELFRNYHLLCYVSQADAPAGRKNSGKVLVISQGRDPPLAQQNLGERPIDAVIFGRWEHPPNRDGLLRIAVGLGEINGKVKIIGPNLMQGIPFPSNVEVLGMVDDIEGYWSKSKVCVIPVWYGAGLQTKVFDALRHGSVVVSTEFTKTTFEANGYLSESICVSDDLIKAANNVIEGWSPSSAKAAYRAYETFFSLTSRQEEVYVRRVRELAEK